MTTTPYQLLLGIDRSDVGLDLVTLDPATAKTTPHAVSTDSHRPAPVVCSQRAYAKDRHPGTRKLYGRRVAIVEPVFGNLRSNKQLNRFTYRGQAKVNVQWNLYCLVHNFEKLAILGANTAKKKLSGALAGLLTLLSALHRAFQRLWGAMQPLFTFSDRFPNLPATFFPA